MTTRVLRFRSLSTNRIPVFQIHALFQLQTAIPDPKEDFIGLSVIRLILCGSRVRPPLRWPQEAGVRRHVFIFALPVSACWPTPC